MPACTIVIVHACTRIVVPVRHACTIATVHDCIIIIVVHAFAEVHACTLATVHAKILAAENHVQWL